MKEKIARIIRILFISICLLLSVTCILYGIKIYRAGYGTSFFMVWLSLGICFIVIAFAIYKKVWHRIPKWLQIAIISISIIGLSCFIWIESCIISEINAKGNKDLDYIIVLGALVHEDGPSSILAARLNSAIEYLEDNPKTLCIVSGGQGSNEPFSEAEGMKRYLIKNGIDESRIIMEDASYNTVQNIKNSKEIINNPDAKVGIVTSKFHVYRAVKIAKKQGIKNVCGISANVVKSYMPSNMFREFFGIVKDTLAGNM